MIVLCKKVFSAICAEFGITGERRSAFANAIAEFEAERELQTALREPLGDRLLKQIKKQKADSEAFAELIRTSIARPNSVHPLARWPRLTLPTTDSGTLDLEVLYGQYDLPIPEMNSSPAQAAVERAAVALLQVHFPALLHYGHQRARQHFDAALDFSVDTQPKKAGRKVDPDRDLLISVLIKRYSTFMDGKPSYSDNSTFVRLCDRLIEIYRIESGDTAQVVQRAMERHKMADQSGSGIDVP